MEKAAHGDDDDVDDQRAWYSQVQTKSKLLVKPWADQSRDRRDTWVQHYEYICATDFIIIVVVNNRSTPTTG